MTSQAENPSGMLSILVTVKPRLSLNKLALGGGQINICNGKSCTKRQNYIVHPVPLLVLEYDWMALRKGVADMR